MLKERKNVILQWPKSWFLDSKRCQLIDDEELLRLYDVITCKTREKPHTRLEFVSFTPEMTIFRDARDDKKLIDDEEFLFLYELNSSKNLDIPYRRYYDEFELDKLTDAECKSEFRFFKHDIYTLLNVLNVPEKVICKNLFYVHSCDEAFCISGFKTICISL